MLRRLLFPQPVSMRLHLADPDLGGGGGEPADKAPEDSFQMPDKFQGKSPEEIAKSYTELEKQLGSRNNSDVDVSEIKQQLSDLRKSWEDSNKKPDDTEDAQNIQKEYFRKLGFVDKDSIQSYKEEAKQEFEFDQEMKSLSKEFDGKDGRPKFEAKDIAKYAQEHGLTKASPNVVYKLKYSEELADWKVKKALEGNKANHVPKGGGKPSPKSDAPNMAKMSPDERKALITKRLEAEQDA